MEAFEKNKNRWQYMGIEKETKHILFAIFLSFMENDFKYLSFHKLAKIVKKYKNDDPDSFIHTRFREDLIFLESYYKSNKNSIFSNGDLYPKIYEHYKKGEISLLTLAILNFNIINFVKVNSSRDIIVWPEFVGTMENIKPLIKLMFNKDPIKTMFHVYYQGQSV